MKITITTLILFLYPVFSQYGMLSGRIGQKAILNSAMDAAGVSRLTCKVGYIGLDCIIPDSATQYKLSCYLKGKPGRSGRGAFIDSDQENTGRFCQQTTVTSVVPTTPNTSTTTTKSNTSTTPNTSNTSTTPNTSTKTTTTNTPTTPAAPVACPLIVDIQKCMNKCVDDVLN
ncbi:hypothetical protein BB560_006699 [Smittium megazygosporum]|uniref:Uncharacterized protein n=1 Tax=Smittium megazygosporum TaxID=133381 RepID=A0A2T9Y2C3_9FUNG|nr:hypothetical protein BB560_006699 [Smittium megazygosporum]